MTKSKELSQDIQMGDIFEFMENSKKSLKLIFSNF